MMARLFRRSPASVGLQESDPSDSVSEELESRESSKEGTPFGLRTRSRIQQQTLSNNSNEEGSDKPIESKIKELLLQLISQAKEQKLEMKELRLALKKGLEQQESIVHDLKEDIAMLHKRIQSQEEKKIEVQLPISDHQPLVNLFRRSDKFSIEESSRSPESADTTKSSRDSPNLDSSGFNPQLASKQDVSQKADPSTLVAKAYMVKAIWKGASSDIDSS
jgi:preprotein translocase subunit SecD